MRPRLGSAVGTLFAGLLTFCQPTITGSPAPPPPLPENAQDTEPATSTALPSLPAPTPSVPATEQALSTNGVPTMKTDDFYAGPLPEGFAMERDDDPLPEGALVKFQVIDRGADPSYNHRWVLYGDGRLYLAWNREQSDFTDLPFDTELPDEPTAILNAELVQQVIDELSAADFINQHPFQAQLLVEDGTTYVVTARLDQILHEVIYDAYAPPLVAFLENIGYDHREDGSDSQDASSDPLNYYENLLKQLGGDTSDETSPLD